MKKNPRIKSNQLLRTGLPARPMLQSQGSKVMTLCFAFFFAAFAAKATLNDFNGNNSNLWNDDGNWSLGHVPTSSEDAEILNGATVTLDVDADLHKFFIGNGSTLNFDGTHSMNVSNDCTIGNGTGTNTMNLVSGSALSVSNNIGGNGGGHLNTSSGGTVTCSGSFFPNNLDIGSGSGDGKLILNGSSGSFNAYTFHDLEIAGNYTMGGSGSGFITGTFTVDAGVEFNPGGSSNVLNGSGTAVFAGSGTIDVTNTTASSDNFGIQYHTFGSYNGDQGLTIQFKGTAVQQINSSIFGAVIINNSHGVNLEGNTEFHGDLTLTSGTFYVDDNIIINLFQGLTIGTGTLSFSSNGSYLMVYDDGAASALTIPGTYTVGHLYVNRAAGVNLGGDLTINSSIVLLNGALNLGTHTLTLNGSMTYTSGSISGSSSSTIIVGDGSGAATLELYAVSNIGALVINRQNGADLQSSVTATSVTVNSGAALYLLAGLACTGDITGAGTIAASADESINVSGNLTVATLDAVSWNMNIFMNGSGAQNLGSGTYTCHNLTIGASSSTTIVSNLSVYNQITGNGTLELGAYTLSSQGDITVKNFTADAGSTVIMGNYFDNVSLGSGSGTYTLNDITADLGGPSVYLQQDITINGKLTITSGGFLENGHAVTYGASSSLTFNGTSGEQTTTDAMWPSANPPATVTINNADGVSLHTDRTTTNLIFTSGTLKLNDHNLTIASGGSITGYNSSKYVYTNSTGRLWMTASTSGTVFPIGDGYNPITITPAASGAVFSAGVANGITDESGSPVSSHALNVQWDVVQVTGVTQNVGIEVAWSAGDELTGFDRTNSFIAYRTSPTTGSYTPTTPSDGSSFTQSVTIPNMSTSTPYYLGVSDPVSPLPVTLVSFTAAKNGSSVNLNWQTASEQNNDYFDIERSLDGRSWKSIGRVQGSGNSNTIQNYNAADNLAGVVPAGNIYYRLKQVDYNGKFQYSNVRSVAMTETSSGMASAYPNPVTNMLHVNFINTANENVTVSLINLNGVSVYEQTVTGKGMVQKQIDMSALPAGLYMLHITGGNTILGSQMINKK